MPDDRAARLDTLKKAKESGVLSIRHGDTMTTFRSLAEIDAIILALTDEIEAAGGAVTRKGPRFRYPIQVIKGL